MRPQRWELLGGDCVEAMRGMAAESVDAVCCDPPYALSFMSHRWDRFDGPRAFQAWSEEWAREAYRVLKPGGYLLAFGGTRTYHRMASGIEDAGFEIRDSLIWIFGSGFPKSINVADHIDRRLGAEPRVVGERRISNVNLGAMGYNGGGVEAGDIPITEPTTEEARAWKGWGTALKPAHEPIVCARKQPSGTIAENVMAHGTGALNIDAARVGATVETWPASRSHSPGRMPLSGEAHGEAGETQRTGAAPAGRWPANVALSHLEGCEPVGERRVKSGAWGVQPTGSTPGDGLTMNDGWRDVPSNPSAVPDEDGMETVTEWRCEEGCPVAELDRQSGVTASQGVAAWSGHEVYGWASSHPKGEAQPEPQAGREIGYGDVGGASRYFYCAKASKGEREAGLEALEARLFGMSNAAQGAAERGEGYRDEGDIGLNRVRRLRNHHPTVKPIDLMRWLVRLVTPPDGLVLDPFAGSGSTGCAALVEGFRFVGVERNPEYLPIVHARLARWEQAPPGAPVAQVVASAAAERKTRDAGQLDLFGSPSVPESDDEEAA